MNLKLSRAKIWEKSLSILYELVNFSFIRRSLTRGWIINCTLIVIFAVFISVLAEAGTFPEGDIKLNSANIYLNDIGSSKLDLLFERNISISDKRIELSSPIKVDIRPYSQEEADHERCKGNTEVFDYVVCRMSHDWKEIAIKAIVSGIIGFIAGFFSWHYREERYPFEKPSKGKAKLSVLP